MPKLNQVKDAERLKKNAHSAIFMFVKQNVNYTEKKRRHTPTSAETACDIMRLFLLP